MGISRRKFLKHGVGLGIAAAAGLASVSLQTDRLVRGLETNYTGADQNVTNPTRIDVHGHNHTGLSADGAIALMNKAGISQMVLMALNDVKEIKQGSHDNQTVSIYKQYPDRFLPFVSTMYQSWYDQDESVLSWAETQLSSGIFKGVGEVLLRHINPSYEVINISADSPFIKKLGDIVVKYNVVMTVHLEWTDDAVASLGKLLEYNKQLKLIWAHLGDIRHSVEDSFTLHTYPSLGEILDRYPNLYVDFSNMQPALPSAPDRLPAMTDKDGSLPPELKRFFIKYSDRVLWGLDTSGAVDWADEPFTKWTQWADNVVAQLEDQNAADRIMYKNAAKLFNIQI